MPSTNLDMLFARTLHHGMGAAKAGDPWAAATDTPPTDGAGAHDDAQTKGDTR